MAEREDVEIIYGAENVSKWADLNNNQDADEIEARIDWALALAEAQLVGKLTGAPATIPATDNVLWTDAVARSAGVLLYDSRGITDFDPNGKAYHQLSAHRDMVDAFVRDVLMGRVKLDRIVDDAPRNVDLDTPTTPSMTSADGFYFLR